MTDLTPNPQVIHNALLSIPHAKFVLTCCHGDHRDGIITRWVQRCSTEPPMLVVAIPKGKVIEPMLRDARAFALCMVQENDRSMQRLFGNDHEIGDDPFLSISVQQSVTGMPILKQSLVWFDCKLEGHLSPDADCRLYLGQVVAAHISEQQKITAYPNEVIVPPTSNRRVSTRARSIETSKKFKQ